MLRSLPLAFCLWLSVAAPAAEPVRLTVEDADVRLRRVFTLAKESNDSGQVDRMLQLRDSVKKSFARKDLAAAERLVRDAEEVVGLERGGNTMYNLPVWHVNAGEEKRVKELEAKLDAALKKRELDPVTAVIKEFVDVLGSRSGLPDVRREVPRTRVVPPEPTDIADLFLKVIQADPRAYKAFVSGTPAPETLPRTYGSIVQACLTIRPAVEQRQKDRLAILDDVVRGCCKSLLTLQLDEGYFRFPDLRNRSIAFGEAIDRLADGNEAALKDGWVVQPFPDGSTLQDTAEAGMALLEAGRVLKEEEWKQGGAKAAAWAAKQPLSRDFRYNACAVSLLCASHRAGGQAAPLEEAKTRYRIGVAPGQMKTGRWLDPQDARTPNLFLFLRAQNDLAEVLPAGKDREEVVQAAAAVVTSFLEEVEKMGLPLTGLTLHELGRHGRLLKEKPPALELTLSRGADIAVQACQVEGRVRAGVPLMEVAAADQVWSKK
jgi:hypothetical protein